jgi:hypothetical protein
LPDFVVVNVQRIENTIKMVKVMANLKILGIIVLKVEGFLKLEFGLKIHFFGNFIVNIPIF